MPKSEPNREAAHVVANALHEAFISPNETDTNLEAANIVDVVAQAGRSVSFALKQLGLGGAATPMGAIEAHMTAVEKVATAIDGHTGAMQQAGNDVRGSLNNVAEAIRELATAVASHE